MASEVFPLIKTGGLADVAGSLPLALKESGVDVRLFMPAYKGIKDMVRDMQKPIYFGNPLGISDCWVIEAKHPTEDMTIYLLDAPAAFERDGGPYLDANGVDWPDNDLRFALFSRIGALMSLAGDMIGFRPDIIHCNDWQTGLTPALLRQWGGKGIPTVYTIHNLQYQGNFPAWNRERLGISGEQFSVHGLEFHGQISYMKAGIWFSSHLSTVSPTYAKEITTAEYGMGLDGLVSSKAHQLTGIINGINVEEWNPETDKNIAKNYSEESILGKKQARKELLKHFDLANDPLRPVIGIVSRLAEQKGLDLVLAASEEIIKNGATLVLLGSGDKGLEHGFTELQKAYPKHVGIYLGYNEALSHKVIAGSDYLLIPSRFEPCGLTQMFAMRYGTVPIVRYTGGLADTVVDYSVRGEGNGIVFGYASKDDVVHACKRGVELFENRRMYNEVRRRGMKEDFSWLNSAKQWKQLYEEIINNNQH